MSGFLVINLVGEALRTLLLDDFDRDGKFTIPLNGNKAISLENPTEASRKGEAQLSLWLYNLTENEFLHNAPPDAERGKRFPSLPLNLHFLATPLIRDGNADLVMVGKTMQVLHENPVVIVSSEEDDVHEELRIRLERLTIDEQSRIWEALSEPYRLSVGYHVRVARLEADRERDNVPIIDRFHGYGEIPTVQAMP